MLKRISPAQAVGLCMLVFLIFCTIWALRVPVWHGVPLPFNADEPSHFLVVRYIATHWTLPPYVVDYYESSHPPLYYFIGALYYHLWPDGMQAYGLRFLSTVFGLGTIVFVFKTGKLIMDEWPAALAACIVAMVPIFVLISSSVNNDGFTVLVSTGALYWIVRGLKFGFDRRTVLWLCLFIAMASLAKYTCIGLIPVSMAAILWQRGKGGWKGAALVLATFLVTASWWYIRNQVLYGDPLRSAAEQAMNRFGVGAPGQGFHYWIPVGWTMLGSFFAIYPSFPEWPPMVYQVLVWAMAIIVGLGIVASVTGPPTRIKTALGIYALTVLGAVLAYQIKHFQPHGRLLSPAIAVFGLGMVGLRKWIPKESRVFMSVVGLACLTGLTIAILSVPIEGMNP